MRRVVVLLALTLLGCSKKLKSTADLLDIASPEACAALDVRQAVERQVNYPIIEGRETAIRMAEGRPLKEKPYPLAMFRLDDVMSTEVSAAEKKVSCVASLGLALDGKKINVANRVHVIYTVQPNLAKPGELAITSNASSTWDEVSMTSHAFGA